MSCCLPLEALRIRLSRFCGRVRCMFACCGGNIVIQDSQLDGMNKQQDKINQE